MKSPSIVIVDSGLGNLYSVQKAFAYLEISARISNKPEDVLKSDALVLPGVGAFRDGMEGLRTRGLADVLKQSVKAGKPILGICLGMQLLMETSLEMGLWDGLSFVTGKVLPFQADDEFPLKVPHMGWNRVEAVKGRDRGGLLRNVPDGSMFYFVHSYYVEPSDGECILTTTEYGGLRFCSAFVQDNIVGCQFHPEKSGALGLRLLDQFAKLS